jgi:alkaline phosphatase D
MDRVPSHGRRRRHGRHRPHRTRLLGRAAVEPGAVFQYGVASGDPLPDGVVIWTRVTPSPDATPGSGKGAPTTVQWAVRDSSGRVVRRGLGADRRRAATTP